MQDKTEKCSDFRCHSNVAAGCLHKVRCVFDAGVRLETLVGIDHDALDFQDVSEV